MVGYVTREPQKVASYDCKYLEMVFFFGDTQVETRSKDEYNPIYIMIKLQGCGIQRPIRITPNTSSKSTIEKQVLQGVFINSAERTNRWDCWWRR